MAEPDYTTCAKVRQVLSRMMNTTTVPEAEIIAKHDIYAKPPIDAALAGRGAPFTAGSAPDLVQSVATLYTAAGVAIDVFGKADKTGETVNKWIEMADGWLNGIRSGSYSPSGVTAGAGLAVTDPTSEKGLTQTIVGDETDWQFYPETRESS